MLLDLVATIAAGVRPWPGRGGQLDRRQLDDQAGAMVAAMPHAGA